MRLRDAVLIVALMPGAAMAQQNFSCSWGKQGACLDYGDTICSSMGKCVRDSAVCFDNYQCNYEGFTCKSNLTDCADKYDDLQRDYNDLVDRHNDLLRSSQSLLEAFEDQEADLNRTRESLEALRSCLLYASNLDEAQSCSW